MATRLDDGVRSDSDTTGTVGETRKDRKALAKDAGMGQLSLVSILAGTLAAYGAVAVLLAAAGGIAAAINNGTNFDNVAWTQLKTGTGIVVAVVLLVSYFFGGYVAGRMARRSGALNGFGVFLLGVVMALVIGVLVKQAGGGSHITTALRNVGAPTTWHEWRDVGTIAGIASLVAMLLGSMFGGASGDRWHGKLVARAVDPTVGPEAVEGRRATEMAAEADESHLAAERRAAHSEGRHFADPTAAAAPAATERQQQREARLADERRALVDQPPTVPVVEDGANDTERSGTIDRRPLATDEAPRTAYDAVPATAADQTTAPRTAYDAVPASAADQSTAHDRMTTVSTDRADDRTAAAVTGRTAADDRTAPEGRAADDRTAAAVTDRTAADDRTAAEGRPADDRTAAEGRVTVPGDDRIGNDDTVSAADASHHRSLRDRLRRH